MQTVIDLSVQQPANPFSFQAGMQRLLAYNGTSGSPAESPKEQKEDAEETTRLRTILLVEDNLINQKVALRILAQFGYQADTAINGAEALVALEKKSYDLILMDVQMPVMDGISATRSIRAKFGPNEPYIIAVTANVSAEDRKNCYDAGMNDFVTKPIRTEALVAAIAKAPAPKKPAEPESTTELAPSDKRSMWSAK